MQAMQVDEALAYADEWIKGVTLYEGAQGWRVACHTLATEVRRLNIDREALMRRLLMAANIFAEIEAHPERAERLAREAQFGSDAEPMVPNDQAKGRA